MIPIQSDPINIDFDQRHKSDGIGLGLVKNRLFMVGFGSYTFKLYETKSNRCSISQTHFYFEIMSFRLQYFILKNTISSIWIHENINIELLMETYQFKIILK